MAGRHYILISMAFITLIAWAGGVRLLYAKGESMKPAFRKNDLLIVTPAREIKIGDIVAYKQNGAYISHRVSEIKDGIFLTKGDNNKEPDPFPAKEKEILGRVVFIIPTHYVIKPPILPLLYWLLGFALGVLFNRLVVQNGTRV